LNEHAANTPVGERLADARSGGRAGALEAGCAMNTARADAGGGTESLAIAEGSVLSSGSTIVAVPSSPRPRTGRRTVSPVTVPVWRTAAADLQKKQRVVILPQQPQQRKKAKAARARLVADAIEEGSETQSEPEDAQAQREIRMFCTAERLDLMKLEAVLRADPRVGADSIRRFPGDAPEVLHIHGVEGGQGGSNIFFFDFGVAVFWCTSVAEEIEVLRALVAPAEVNSVKARDTTWDQFSLYFSSREQPSIQNDIITISQRSSGIKTKLALSAALAQSTKLLLYEKEVQHIAEATRYIPEDLARSGGCHMSVKDLNRLTGYIFMKTQSLNLVDPLMSIPEWLETESDRLVETYKKVCVYLDIDNRVKILDSRLTCFKDLLALLRDQHHDTEGTKLYMLVIVLLVFCVLLSLVKGVEIVSSYLEHAPAGGATAWSFKLA